MSATTIQNAVNLIADYYDNHNEPERAHKLRSAGPDHLLDIIIGVLLDLSNTTNAYLQEKGSDALRTEIVRLQDELKFMQRPMADEVRRLNERVIALNATIDSTNSGADAKTLKIINDLRSLEGWSVTLICDNPEGGGSHPMNMAEVFGEWDGNWHLKSFGGDSLLDALEHAHVAWHLAIGKS